MATKIVLGKELDADSQKLMDELNHAIFPNGRAAALERLDELWEEFECGNPLSKFSPMKKSPNAMRGGE